MPGERRILVGAASGGLMALAAAAAGTLPFGAGEDTSPTGSSDRNQLTMSYTERSPDPVQDEYPRYRRKSRAGAKIAKAGKYKGSKAAKKASRKRSR